jgi:hypothetical protein
MPFPEMEQTLRIENHEQSKKLSPGGSRDKQTGYRHLMLRQVCSQNIVTYYYYCYSWLKAWYWHNIRVIAQMVCLRPTPTGKIMAVQTCPKLSREIFCLKIIWD